MTTEAGGAGQVPASDPAGQVPAPTPNAPENKPAAAPTEPAMTLEQALDALSKARKDQAAERVDRKRLAELEQVAKDAELAKLGDLEKSQKQLGDAQKQMDAYKATISRMAVELAASKHGFIDTADAAAFVAGKLDIGDDGKPTNVDELLKDLAKTKPYLLKPADAPAGQQQQPKPPALAPTNPGRAPQAPASIDWANAPKLSDPGVWKRPGGN